MWGVKRQQQAQAGLLLSFVYLLTTFKSVWLSGSLAGRGLRGK
jgi:hypothetical protein